MKPNIFRYKKYVRQNEVSQEIHDIARDRTVLIEIAKYIAEKYAYTAEVKTAHGTLSAIVIEIAVAKESDFYQMVEEEAIRLTENHKEPGKYDDHN